MVMQTIVGAWAHLVLRIVIARAFTVCSVQPLDNAVDNLLIRIENKALTNVSLDKI